MDYFWAVCVVRKHSLPYTCAPSLSQTPSTNIMTYCTQGSVLDNTPPHMRNAFCTKGERQPRVLTPRAGARQHGRVRGAERAAVVQPVGHVSGEIAGRQRRGVAVQGDAQVRLGGHYIS